MEIPFDIADPTVVVLSWALTALIGRFISLADKPRLRTALPILAVLLAVAAQAALAAFDGALMVEGAFQWAVLLKGLAAGAVAVAGHSQVRELMKLKPKKGGKKGAAAAVATALVTLLILPGCGAKHSVIRDATVYQAQVEWLAARNVETIAVLDRARLTAVEVKDQDGCMVYSNQLLIARHAITYRHAMMLHLVDLGEDPGDPDVIPDAMTLCLDAVESDTPEED